MCGLVAIVSGGERVKPETLHRAAGTLVHRGPDEYGTWLDGDGAVGLAHRRLAIVDLVSGTQPLANEDETIRAVVNGELYDFEEIRRDLEKRGHRFRTRSDSEILVHLYEDHGAGCLARLRGEFAFVLWDARKRQLFAARDRFGIKPLYFASHRGSLYLASEAKALFAAGVPCRWDRKRFLQQAHRIPSEHQSYFEGVHQIRPGHYLVAEPGNAPVQHRYWDFEYPVRGSERRISDDEAVAQGRELLERAVMRRLQGDVPVGVYLSGGIDSSGIIGLAAKLHSQPVEAFTVAWHVARDNEEALARETARRVGANLHVHRVDQDALADALPRTIWHCESPANLSAAAKFQLSERTRDAGIKVVLTGEGADDVYAGYHTFAADQRGERRPATVGPDLLDEELGFVPGWIRRARRSPLPIDPGFAAEFSSWDPARQFLEDTGVAKRLVGLEPLNVSLYLWSKIRLLHFFLTTVSDRTEMAHGVEGRTPYLDDDLVEFACTLPTSLKLRDGTEKFLLRECVRPVVTDTLYRRKKRGFAPPVTPPRGRLLELYRDTLHGSHAHDLPFYAQPVMAAYLERAARVPPWWRLRKGSQNRLRKDLASVESMVALCLMQEQFGPS